MPFSQFTIKNVGFDPIARLKNRLAGFSEIANTIKNAARRCKFLLLFLEGIKFL